jgi:hypothetical protein
MYYVYVARDYDGVPIYVGKGNGSRHTHCTRKWECTVEIVERFETVTSNK